MTYVTLVQAKQHLKIDMPDQDADIYAKLAQASAIVADYLKSRADEDWDEATTPAPVQAATLLVLTHLDASRGDDMSTDDRLWAAVGRLLMRYRDPALA